MLSTKHQWLLISQRNTVCPVSWAPDKGVGPEPVSVPHSTTTVRRERNMLNSTPMGTEGGPAGQGDPDDTQCYKAAQARPNCSVWVMKLDREHEVIPAKVRVVAPEGGGR